MIRVGALVAEEIVRLRTATDGTKLSTVRFLRVLGVVRAPRALSVFNIPCDLWVSVATLQQRSSARV